MKTLFNLPLEWCDDIKMRSPDFIPLVPQDFSMYRQQKHLSFDQIRAKGKPLKEYDPNDPDDVRDGAIADSMVPSEDEQNLIDKLSDIAIARRDVAYLPDEDELLVAYRRCDYSDLYEVILTDPSRHAVQLIAVSGLEVRTTPDQVRRAEISFRERCNITKKAFERRNKDLLPDPKVLDVKIDLRHDGKVYIVTLIDKKTRIRDTVRINKALHLSMTQHEGHDDDQEEKEVFDHILPDNPDILTYPARTVSPPMVASLQKIHGTGR